MGHVGKYTKSSCGKLMAHYERRKKDGEYVKFGNINIDTSRTHLNYNLAPARPNQYKFMEKRLNEIFVYGRGGKRTDIKTMADWAITLPKTFPKGQEREFFEKSYDFLAERYGEENVISSYVHVDETSPHMHFSFVPVVFDKAKDRDKLSAKQMLNVYDLKTFHKDLDKSLTEYFKFEVGILNGATIGGNKTIVEMKLATAMKNLEKANLTIEKQTNDLEKYSAFRGNIEDVDSIDFKKNKVVNKKSGTVEIADFERVKNIAKVVPLLQVEIKALAKELTAAKQETKDMEDRWYKSYKQIEPLNAEISVLSNSVRKIDDYLAVLGVSANTGVLERFNSIYTTHEQWTDLKWHLKSLKVPISEESITNRVDALMLNTIKFTGLKDLSDDDIKVATKLGSQSIKNMLDASPKFNFNDISKDYEINPDPKVEQKIRTPKIDQGMSL